LLQPEKIILSNPPSRVRRGHPVDIVFARLVAPANDACGSVVGTPKPLR
jgi:hypothetical protein